jgi:cyclic nucleotide gated channel
VQFVDCGVFFSSVVDEHSKTPTAKSDTKDGGDTRTNRKWPIFNPVGKFLPMWNNMFVISCVFAVSFDPLFFYIPIIDEKNKCLMFDTRLKAIALGLRLLSDLLYIADIIMRILISIPKTQDQEAPNSKAKKSFEDVLAIAKRVWAKTNRSYILIDIFAVLPIPQVIKRSLFCSKLNCFH